jgi:hypothetical protein
MNSCWIALIAQSSNQPAARNHKFFLGKSDSSFGIALPVHCNRGILSKLRAAESITCYWGSQSRFLLGASLVSVVVQFAAVSCAAANVSFRSFSETYSLLELAPQASNEL